MSADLMQRLREAAVVWGEDDGGSMYAEAADALAALTRERDSLKAALKWYADGEHFSKAAPESWDTVSGEPQNWWCDEAGTAMIEDGSLAGMVLAGKLDGAKLGTLQDGEVVDAAPTPAAKPQETGAHTREAICAALLVGLPLSAEQRASLLVMLRTAGDAEALRDARRYRWLEEHTVATGLVRWIAKGKHQLLGPAVDAALAADAGRATQAAGRAE